MMFIMVFKEFLSFNGSHSMFFMTESRILVGFSYMISVNNEHTVSVIILWGAVAPR